MAIAGDMMVTGRQTSVACSTTASNTFRRPLSVSAVARRWRSVIMQITGGITTRWPDATV